MDLRSQSQTGGRGRFKLRSPASQIQVLFLVQSQKLGHNSPFPIGPSSAQRQVLLNRPRCHLQGSCCYLGEPQGVCGRSWTQLSALWCSTLPPWSLLNQMASYFHLWLLFGYSHRVMEAMRCKGYQSCGVHLQYDCRESELCSLCLNTQGHERTPYKAAHCFFGHLWLLVRSCAHWAGSSLLQTSRSALALPHLPLMNWKLIYLRILHC